MVGQCLGGTGRVRADGGLSQGLRGRTWRGIAAGQGEPVAGAQVRRSLWHEGHDEAVDARMLARMGVAFDLEPQAPQSKNMRDLRDLHVARAGLIKDQTRLRNRAQTQDISVLKRQTKTRLTLVER